MSLVFYLGESMTREAIVKAASEMKTVHDLLILLNMIKKDELGDKSHSFIMPHLNYFINPKRNKKNYRTFEIPKKSGGVRTISAPTKMLKSLLTYTNRILQAYYEAPECVMGFVPSRSVVDNTEKHVGKHYVFNTDLKDFFPSISKSRVWATLKCPPFSFKDTIADAIAGLCCTEVEKDGETIIVLPQGSPSSPILTNIVCRNLDRQLSRLAGKYHIAYSRYADDITFSSDHNVYQEEGDFRKELKNIITKEHFTFNDKKTRLQKSGCRQEVTGLIVSDRVNVPRDYIRELDNLLYIWEKYGYKDAFTSFMKHYTPKQNYSGGTPNMESVVEGKLMYLKMVKGEDDPVWKKLQKRFAKLAGKRKKRGEDIDYINVYSISSFEESLECKLSFSIEEDKATASFILNGKTTPVAISKYCRTRLGTILESGDDKSLEKFKKHYHIGYCFNGSYFWMIFRKQLHGKEDAKPGVLDVDQILEMLSSISVPQIFSDSSLSSQDEATDDTEKKPLNEVLEELVISNFDLKTLDKWDKKKNT